MNRWRLLILMLGPLPIVAASLGVARWVRPNLAVARTSNEAWVSRAALPRARQASRGATAIDHLALAADCERQAEEMRGRLPNTWCVLVRPPFVLASDLEPGQVEGWYLETIRPAASALGHMFCRREPDQPLAVYLCSGEQEYLSLARRLFGDEGVSIFGYFKPRERVLVLNIATGGGTLVHELTHALLAFDFPQVPDWFNEGLASLYEQCHISADGQEIVGLVNWRLPILKQAISQGQLPGTEQLLAPGAFRQGDEALRYAQARYLCLWLQEQGRLVDFYCAFRERALHDPQGLATLASLFPGQEWAEIDARFARWARDLPQAR